ncbi:MAG: hypothetical protein ABSG28_06445 [Methanoregula sp.]|jgi:hypothetical protein|uniref:hypothetical protein n=1 Tax=Methanoregula sp. TaxID=2052170 RepID=UPI003C1EF0B4
MSKFYGINPQPATRQAVGKFEDEVMIRKDNRYLISTVYLDMQEDSWAVAVAYNPSRNPGLLGHDHLLEVRYTYSPKNRTTMTMLRSDPLEELTLAAGPFPDPDTFARYAITFERDLVNRQA